jgi:hypothetical protein
MEPRIIWIVFFAVLMVFGFGVAVFPAQVARLVGAQRKIEGKSGLLLVWRGLGGLVLIVSVIELVLLFIVGHVVR